MNVLDFKSFEVKTSGSLYGGYGTATGAGSFEADGEDISYSADTRDSAIQMTYHTQTDVSTGLQAAQTIESGAEVYGA